MSENNQESGLVTLPTSEFKRLHSRMLEAYNDLMKELLKNALLAHSEILLEKKGKRGFDTKTAVDATSTQIVRPYKGRSNYEYKAYSFKKMVENSLLNDNKLKKPNKKDFLLLKKSDFVFEDDDLTIVFNKKDKSVSYQTDEGNRCLDSAEESHMGRLLLRLLDSVKFTNRTGGYFEAVSEYYENDFGQGGQSRISRTYGKYKTNKKLAKQLHGL
jgi:hypothetical protein